MLFTFWMLSLGPDKVRQVSHMVWPEEKLVFVVVLGHEAKNLTDVSRHLDRCLVKSCPCQTPSQLFLEQNISRQNLIFPTHIILNPECNLSQQMFHHFQTLVVVLSRGSVIRPRLKLQMRILSLLLFTSLLPFDQHCYTCLTGVAEWNEVWMSLPFPATTYTWLFLFKNVSLYLSKAQIHVIIVYRYRFLCFVCSIQDKSSRITDPTNGSRPCKEI